MSKINIITVDSSKGDEFFIKDSVVCLNCNAYFKKCDSLKLREIDKQYIKNLEVLNLCNFASLCYKFEILYNSFEAINLFNNIIDLLTLCNSQLQICQENIENYLEIDCLPIEHLFKITDNDFFINLMLKNLLKFIGFADSQLFNICMNYKINEIIPKDLLQKVPLKSKLTDMTYFALKEVL